MADNPDLSYSWGASIEASMNIPDYNEPYDITPYIFSFGLFSDYEKNQFPIYSLVFYAPLNIISTIQNYGSRIRYVINVDYKRLVEINQYGNKPHNNTDFTVNSFPFLRNAVMKSIENDTNEPLPEDINSIEPNQAVMVKYELLLFEVNHLNWNSELISSSFNDTTLEDVVYYLSTTITKKKPIMNVLDNRETYKIIKVPPLNLSRTLHYLQSYYGLYKDGLKFFMDSKNVFILPKTATRNRFRTHGSPGLVTIEVLDYKNITTRLDILQQLRNPVYERSGDFSDVLVRCNQRNLKHKLANLAGNVINGSTVKAYSSSQKSHANVTEFQGTSFPDDHVDKLRYIHSTTTSPVALAEASRKSIESIHQVTFLIHSTPHTFFDCDTKVVIDYTNTEKAPSFKNAFRPTSVTVLFERVINSGNKPMNLFMPSLTINLVTLGE